MFNPLIGDIPGTERGHLLIEAGVLSTVAGFRQTRVDLPEAGGILLGYRRGPHLHVIEATTPMPDDHQARYRFYRSGPPHQRIATTRWQFSGGTLDYIGEWHSHPEATPRPSTIDLTAWKELYASRNTALIFLIVGNQQQNWYGQTQNGHLHEIKMRPIDV